MRKYFYLVLILLILQGCSNPFGQNSLIETISNGIGAIFGKTTTTFVAGGTQKFVTPGSYNVSASVGNYINQNQVTTSGGYKVMTSIQTSQ